MKRHILHSRAAAAAGLIPPRCTGRSTAQALDYLATAMKRPGVEFFIQDHHNFERYCEGKRPLRVVDDMLIDMCRAMVNRLGLDGFVFDKNKSSIKWEAYQEVGDDE